MLTANASCTSSESQDIQPKELNSNLPDDSIKSTAAITGAASTANASWTRVEVNTTASPPYSSVDPRSSAKATCDADFVYTITMPGKSGMAFLKPRLNIWAGAAYDLLGASARASLGVATCAADAPPSQALENDMSIPFSFGERLDLHLHLEATSTAHFTAGGPTEPIASDAWAEFSGISIHLDDTDIGPDVSSQCTIVRDTA